MNEMTQYNWTTTDNIGVRAIFKFIISYYVKEMKLYQSSSIVGAGNKIESPRSVRWCINR